MVSNASRAPLMAPARPELLAATPLFDHTSPAILQLMASRGWLALLRAAEQRSCRLLMGAGGC